MRNGYCYLSESEMEIWENRSYRKPSNEHVPSFLDDISEVEAELDEVPEFYEEKSEIIDFPMYSHNEKAA